jgi:hypothetical protein
MSALLDGNGLSILGGVVFVLTFPVVTMPLFFALEYLERRINRRR